MWAVQCAAGRPVGPFSSLSGKYCALHHIADDAATDAHSFFSAPGMGGCRSAFLVRALLLLREKGDGYGIHPAYTVNVSFLFRLLLLAKKKPLFFAVDIFLHIWRISLP